MSLRDRRRCAAPPPMKMWEPLVRPPPPDRQLAVAAAGLTSPLGTATADENHGAQTALYAVCGFSSPNCPKAADFPEMQEVRYPIYFHGQRREWC